MAERTGKGLTLEHVFHEEGDAPPELLPRVMEGVVRRAGEAYGEPREVAIEASPENYQALVDEFDPALLVTEETDASSSTAFDPPLPPPLRALPARAGASRHAPA